MNSSPVPPPPSARKGRTGLITVLVGFIIMIAPAFIAMIGSWISSTGAYDEGSGWGAMWWLMIVTIPVGLIIMVVGGLIGMIRAIINRKKK